MRKNGKSFHLYFFAILIGALSAFLFCSQSFAQNSIDHFNLPNLIYYDGDEITINKNTGIVTIENNATILIGKTYISAHKISFNQTILLVSAEGNVQIILDKEKATASRLVYDGYTKQFRMDNAEIFSDPTTTDEVVAKDALGITKAEIAFEKYKKLRILELDQQLRELREKYIMTKNLQSVYGSSNQKLQDDEKEITRRYSQLLARNARTQYQPNIILAALPEKLRDKLQERRIAVENFNKDNPNLANQVFNFTALPGYVHASASQIIQKDPNTYLLNEAVVTPCHCSTLGEPPLYGFSAKSAEMEIGEYITMRSVTVNFASIPFFYTPWIKMPIKTKRETGFLLPSGYMSNNAGQELSIPFFIVLGPSADSTVTYENFSQRGSQLSDEFRLQINQDSQLYLNGKIVQDKLYNQTRTANNLNIDQAIAASSDPALNALYESSRGSNLTSRWYTSGSLNMPLSSRLSLKTNAQFVSDNSYLSDFSTNNPSVNPTATITGDTSASSKRFLNQEADGEYYGDDTVLSLRAQGLRDLFAVDHLTTPIRLPRIEFDLLPKKYFDLPIVFSNTTQWEHIQRPAGPFEIIPNYPANFSPHPLPAPAFNTIGNNDRVPFNPYLQGERGYTTSILTLPFPTNDYFNAYLSATATGAQYFFPPASPFPEAEPHMSYLEYKGHLDVPLFGRLDLTAPNSGATTQIIQSFTPFVEIDYIPNVERSTDFPNTYQLWYAQDNTVSTNTISLGATTSWTIQRESYVKSPASLDRIPVSRDPGVSNLKYLAEAAQEEEPTRSKSSDTNIYSLSSEKDSAALFELWAQKELNAYFNIVSAGDFKRNYIWPNTSLYQRQLAWSYTPLSISLSSGYNLLADDTAKELNYNAGPYAAPILVSKFTDVNAQANMNYAPFLPVTTSAGISYNQAYHHISSMNAGITGQFPYGLQVAYTYSEQMTISLTDQTSFVRKTQQAANFIYLPWEWIQFGFQWAKNSDPNVYQSIVNLSGGRNYAASENITFLNLQNCVDLILSRNKVDGIPEDQATYAIGIKMKIFGYSTGFDQVGDYLNRKLQK